MSPHGGSHHDDSTYDPLMDGKHPGRHSGNRNYLLPGIIPQTEKDSEKELSHTRIRN